MVLTVNEALRALSEGKEVRAVWYKVLTPDSPIRELLEAVELVGEDDSPEEKEEDEPIPEKTQKKLEKAKEVIEKAKEKPVAGGRRDLISVENRNRIISLYFDNGETIPVIAKMTGVNYHTVRSIIKKEEVRKAEQQSGKLDDLAENLVGMMSDEDIQTIEAMGGDDLG